MTSTYSSLLQLELIGSGDQANAWGNTTNNNLQYGLEYSIAGVYTKNLSSASSPYTLTTANTISSAQADNENRQSAIIFTGQGSNFIIQVAATQKTFSYEIIILLILLRCVLVHLEIPTLYNQAQVYF